MNEAARNAVVEALENLANQESWNAAAWQKCFNFVTANWDDELMKYFCQAAAFQDSWLARFSRASTTAFRAASFMTTAFSRQEHRMSVMMVTQGSAERFQSL